MLTSLDLANFKSWPETPQVRLAPITGLFGPNSSGKSSILQFLLMLKQTVESPDRMQVLNFGDEKSYVNLGTFREVVYRHKFPSHLYWRLDWTLPKELRVADPGPKRGSLFTGKDLTFAAQIIDNSGRMVVHRVLYRFANQDFEMKRKSESAGKYELTSNPKETFDFKRTQGRPWELPPPVKCYGFPDQVKAYYQNAGFLADFELAFEELFSRTFYLGPLRDYPKRQYTWAGAQPADMGQRGERFVDAMLSSRQRGEKIGRGRGRSRLSLEEYVAEWLRDLGLVYNFSVEAISKDSNLYRVWVEKGRGSTKVLLTDVGFGVSQVLPVLALCYYVPEGSTILLEQPEIHLHPAVQAGLADVFIDAVKNRKVQIIVESHSEHLLRRLQRRIAEETFSSDDAALYFCDINEGVSKITSLELDLFGRILNWPRNFFGDEFAEMAATTEAQMRRRKQGVK
jgi:predicted ATPase